MCTSDVNDAELFNAEPRLLVIDAEDFYFLKKNEPETRSDFYKT